jgi:hypothetical protein
MSFFLFAGLAVFPASFTAVVSPKEVGVYQPIEVPAPSVVGSV